MDIEIQSVEYSAMLIAVRNPKGYPRKGDRVSIGGDYNGIVDEITWNYDREVVEILLRKEG